MGFRGRVGRGGEGWLLLVFRPRGGWERGVLLGKGENVLLLLSLLLGRWRWLTCGCRMGRVDLLVVLVLSMDGLA